MVARRLGRGWPATTWTKYRQVVATIQLDAVDRDAALIFCF
jgi:hypothetical protein